MKKIKIIFYIFIIGIILWIACTSIVYRFFNPSKTEVQAFLHIPKSFVLDFSEGVKKGEYYGK